MGIFISSVSAEETLGDKKPIVWWKFDEGRGKEAIDSSGNGLNGQMNAEWRKGSYGTAVYLDGSPQKTVKIKLPGDYQVNDSDFSIEAWVYPINYGPGKRSPKRRLFTLTSSWPASWVVVDFILDGRLQLDIGLEKDGKYIASASVSQIELILKEWHHIAITLDRENGEVIYYINGWIDTTASFNPKLKSTQFISSHPFEVGSSFQGVEALVDEFKYYKRVLTSKEIAESFKEKERMYIK